MVRKCIRWIPVVLSIAIIIGLTLQDSYQSGELTVNTSTIIENTVENIGVVPTTQAQEHWWNDFIQLRKIAHSIEYIPLGITVCYAFKKNRVLNSIAFCMVISLMDQSIKHIVPIRHFDWTDLPYDFVGYMLGIGITLLIINRIKRSRL